MGLAADQPVKVDDTAFIATSFPDFIPMMALAWGGVPDHRHRWPRRVDHRHRRTRGSGKGTLGKRLAEHYGYRHLDTGVIYRAVAEALLDAGADLTMRAGRLRGAGLDPEKFGNPALKTRRWARPPRWCRQFPRCARRC